MSNENSFWLKAVRELLALTITALYHAYGRVTLDDILEFINSVPQSEEQAADAEFRKSSFCYTTLRTMFEAAKVPLPNREAVLATAYFGKTLSRLDAKTRSNIIITLTAEISRFTRGPLHSLFCTRTNVIPEATHEGAIWIVDLPIKRFERTGAIAQKLVKYLWQKATERRTVSANTRPVFLFADEAQLFISPYDLEFLSTARSSRAAVVYITQNLPSLNARIGGRNPHDQVDAIAGNFQTKTFHANSDPRTNQWAADIIGKAIQQRRSGNWSQGDSSQTSEGHGTNWGRQYGESEGKNWGSGGGISWSGMDGPVTMSTNSNSGRQKGTSWSRSTGGNWSHGTSCSRSTSRGGGWSEQVDYVIRPSDFTRLRQGGPRNNFRVTAIMLQANRRFSRTGTCWMPVAFQQRELLQ